MLRGSFVACLNMIKYKPISHQKTRENDKRLAYHIAGPEQNRTELSRRSGGEHASGMKISIQTLIAHVTHIHSAVHAQWFVSGSRFCMVIGIASELSSGEMAVPALVHYSIPFASIKCIWWLGFVHTNLPNYYWFSVAYLSKAFMIFSPSDRLLFSVSFAINAQIYSIICSNEFTFHAFKNSNSEHHRTIKWITPSEYEMFFLFFGIHLHCVFCYCCCCFVLLPLSYLSSW